MSNFTFLESHWGGLAKFGDLSEKYVYSDPNTSIIKQGTIKKLEENGILTIKDLIGKSVDDLVNMGIHKNYADLIIGYIRRRMV